MAVCCGCLASDRILRPLNDQLSQLLKLLLLPKKRSGRNDKYCWECCALLQKISDFQCQIVAAHTLMKEVTSGDQVDFKPVSNLNTIIKEGYDIVIEEGKDIKEEHEDDNESVISDEYDNYKSDVEDIKGHKNTFELSDNNINRVNDNICLHDNKFNTDEYVNNSDLLDINESDVKIFKKIITDKCVQAKVKERYKRYIVLKNRNIKVSDLMKDVEVQKSDYSVVKEWYEIQKRDDLFLSSPYKCMYCLTTFKRPDIYKNHFWMKHRSSFNEPKFRCDICDRGLPNKRATISHMKTYKYKYICKICNEHFYILKMTVKHLLKHTTKYQCKKCGYIFDSRRDFLTHYKEIHECYVCDYCGISKRCRRTFELHVQRHTMTECGICKIKFKCYKSFISHYKMQHVKDTEEAYCVECDVKFPNVNRFKYHLRTSVKHKKPPKGRYPCPVCDKVYAKNLTMKYHYQHHHLKKTKFYCEKCDKYLLNPYSLRLHNASVHDKIRPAKNKFCDICGRGFSSNKLLIYHRRTHTGEKPFKCEICPISFAQPTPLKTHMKTQHGQGTPAKMRKK